jgi:uncharacterized protein YecE (DUF72 family)
MGFTVTLHLTTSEPVLSCASVRVLVGTSGYSYAPWKGSFYPEKLPAAKMLGYYASQLPTVEINNTFYRMPVAEMLQKWSAETPGSFSFVLKSPKRITHEKRLLDTGDTVKRFYEVAAALGPKLGPTLFQLPPNLKKDVPRLEAFLAQLRAAAPDARPAFEFRHESWFSDDVYAALRAQQAALCIAEDEELATPLEATASWGYLRLRRQDYDDAALAAWAERLRGQPWSDTHVFFKHEDEGKGPKLAVQMISLCGQM